MSKQLKRNLLNWVFLLQGSLDGWKPDELSRKLRSGRNIRWTVVVALALVAIGVSAAILWLPTIGERRAAATATTYREALVDLRNVLPESQLALAAVTDPATSPDGVAAVVPITADLEARAHRVSVVGAIPLPSTPPLVPRAPLDLLQPVRARMGTIGPAGEEVARRLGHGFVYRTTIPLILATPDLPTTGDDTVVADLSVALASVLADSVGLVDDLPDSPAFSEMKTLIQQSVTWFSTWQVEYLEALRVGDSEAAAELVDELDTRRAELRLALFEALAQLRVEVDAAILALAGEIDVALVMIP